MLKFRPQQISKKITMQYRLQYGRNYNLAWQIRARWYPVGRKPNQVSIARRFAQLHYLACHAPAPVQTKYRAAYAVFYRRLFGSDRASLRYLNAWSGHAWL
jgi:hypothetical protein